jgi:hypothetical protein
MARAVVIIDWHGLVHCSVSWSCLAAEPGHEARLLVGREVEQVGARLTENELECPTAAVAPLARQGQRTSEGSVTHPRVVRR